jgi:Flp pilus assembly protein TadG
LVELAISLPLLSLFLLGSAELAQGAYAAIEVSNAAHAAVQYGASSSLASADYTQSGSTYRGGIVNAATNDAANLTGVTVTSITPACTCANTAYTPSSCTDNVTCSSHYTAMVETLTVQTKARFYPMIQSPGGASYYDLYGQASQVVSNQ